MHQNIAKVIVLTKNEYDLIESFIKFYGSLFGYDNIVIVDNGSTDKRVHNVYKKYSDMGIKVIIDRRNFIDANKWMSEHIRDLKGTCEWVFVLETDEYIFWTKDMYDKNSTVPKETIINYLKDLPEYVSYIEYKYMLKTAICPSDEGYIDFKYDNPPLTMTKFNEQGWGKVIIRIDRFTKMSQWSHKCDVSHGYKFKSNDLGLLHYHDTGSKRRWERTFDLVNTCNYFNTELPIYIQIPLCNYHVREHSPIYHRYEFYLIYLYRKFIIQHFKTFMDRLPTLQELQELYELKNCDKIIEKIIEMKTTNKFPQSDTFPKSYDELIYYEEAEDYEYEIFQVSNYMASII